MALLKKILYIRLILAALIIIAVLFINSSATLMVFLLILSSLLSLLDLTFEAFNDFKNKKFFSQSAIAIFVSLIGFLFNYEFEAAIFALTYRLSLVILDILYDRIESKQISSVKSLISRKRLSDVLSYNNATEYKTGKEIIASVMPVLLAVILISVLIIILLPLIGHYTFRVSVHRSLMVLYLSLPGTIYMSLKIIGLKSLSAMADNGLVFNCAESIETKNLSGIVAGEDRSNLLSGYNIDYNPVIDEDTFKNIIHHIAYQSDQTFAKQLCDDIEGDIDENLIQNFTDFYGKGISCQINNMDVFLGNKSFFDMLGADSEDMEEDTYYLYLSSRCFGNFKIIENNVSVLGEQLNIISDKMGKDAVKVAFATFIVKAILIMFSIIGLFKLWLVVLIETIAEILIMVLTSKFSIGLTPGLQ